jgi:hypothetical protein
MNGIGSTTDEITHTQLLSENLNGKSDWLDLGVNERMKLKYRPILKRG